MVDDDEGFEEMKESLSSPLRGVEHRIGKADVLFLEQNSLTTPNEEADDQIPDLEEEPREAKTRLMMDPEQVAKQSTWYLEPPSFLGEAQFINVKSEIIMRPFREGRPQTAQPVLQRTAPIITEEDEESEEEELKGYGADGFQVGWNVS